MEVKNGKSGGQTASPSAEPLGIPGTSTQLQQTHLPAKERPKIYDLAVTRGIRPTSYEELSSFAQLYHVSGLAPKSFDTWQQVMIASAMCLEMGRPIATGLQDMAVINGRVGIFGDAALAVIRGSGLLEEITEWSVGTPFTDDWTFFCKVRRVGEAPCKKDCGPGECKDPLHCASVGSWSWLESKRAGFDDPKMRGGEKDTFSPWRRFTKRMMQFKARNFINRDKFGDVLKGITTVEDLQDSPIELVNVTPETALADKKAAAVYEIRPGASAEKAEGQGMGKAEIVQPGAAQEVKEQENPAKQTVIPQASGNGGPEEPMVYKVLKTMRPGKGAQAKSDFVKLVTDNIGDIEKWPAMYRDHIKAKWDSKVGEVWPTYGETAALSPEVKPGPTTNEKELFEIDDGHDEEPPPPWEEQPTPSKPSKYEISEPKSDAAPTDYDIIVAYLNGPIVVPADANERLVSVTRFDAYIGKKMGDLETNLPIDAKSFMAFMARLVAESKGKYKDAGSVKVSIWKQDLIEPLWMGYLNWMIQNDK